MEQEESAALATARADLAHAETHITAAHDTLEDANVDLAGRHQAEAELAYYNQLATRYRGQIARLLRGDMS